MKVLSQAFEPLKLAAIITLVALPCCTACTREKQAPKSTLVDCGSFESRAKEIHDLPDEAYRNGRGTSEIGYLTELAVRWCSSASPAWTGGRDGADRSVQFQLFHVPRNLDNEAAPVKPQHAEAISRLTALAEKMLCPNWQSVPYVNAQEVIHPEATRITCRR